MIVVGVTLKADDWIPTSSALAILIGEHLIVLGEGNTVVAS